MKIRVAIPSYKRAGEVTSHILFPQAEVVVPESQADAYREYHGDAVRVIPDKLDGSIARKRNAIIDLAFGDGVDWLVMVDDDYEYVGRQENGQQKRLRVEDIATLIEDGCRMAEELDTGLWGLNVQSDPKFFREYAPFSMLSPILGPWHALKVCDLRYDESIPLKEDYDYWLQVIERWHRTLRFNGYHYKVNHLNRAGGVVSQRTRKREMEQLQMFQRKWGSGIVSYDAEKSVNPRVRVPLRGI